MFSLALEDNLHEKNKDTNNNAGSGFDDFLKEEGIFEKSNETAIKRVLEWREKKKCFKISLATQKNPSSAALDRFCSHPIPQ